MMGGSKGGEGGSGGGGDGGGQNQAQGEGGYTQDGMQYGGQ